jgi:hypothetical protein
MSCVHKGVSSSISTKNCHGWKGGIDIPKARVLKILSKKICMPNLDCHKNLSTWEGGRQREKLGLRKDGIIKT